MSKKKPVIRGGPERNPPWNRPWREQEKETVRRYLENRTLWNEILAKAESDPVLKDMLDQILEYYHLSN